MEQLDRITSLIDDVVGSKVVGVYLHGSSVAGGLKPASDIDVLVVTTESLTKDERTALTDGLMPISGPGAGERSVELTVVVQSEVKPWHYPPTTDFLYGDWMRAEIEMSGPPAPEPAPGLALTIPMTIAGNQALSGPPPAEVFEPVPPADIVRGCVDGIPSLLVDLPGDTRNVLLTFARIWSTAATGDIRSKDAAADWALDQLPPEHQPVLAHARELYLTTTYADEEPWPDSLRVQVGPHVEHVLGEIRKLAEPSR